MSSDDKIDRLTFLKQAGLLAGAGTAGLFLPSNISQKWKSDKLKVFVPTIQDLTYWEMLMFSCLQGIANRENPNIFLYYPDKTSESWDSDRHAEERYYYEWYKKYEFLEFTEVNTPYHLFEELEPQDILNIEGFIIVDNAIPHTANIAANYSSSENLLPVTQSLLDSKQTYLPTLPVKRDLRSKFNKMTKLELYEWAYHNQWPQTNHDVVANLGTPDSNEDGQLPVNSFSTSNRARDYTVAEQGFFFDLSSSGKDFKLKDKILGEMNPQGYVFGWHQGASEAQHISQLSSHGQLALGASTYAANYSFFSRVKVAGAVERFKTNIVTNRNNNNYQLEDKIYLTFALSDGDSLNFISRKTMGRQWQLAQRGDIPFGWEMQPLLADIAPGILDYYQATATDNDYFVDGVSGIGYFYPEEMPEKILRKVLKRTRDYLESTGETSITVMSPTGPVSDKTAAIYQEILGEHISGVMEGYVRRKADRVRIYNDEEGGHTCWLPTSNPRGDESVENWVEGLKKVASTRKRRPLFIPLHIPAHQLTIADMVELTDKLGEEFKAVPPDSFYRLFAEARSDAVVLNPPESFPVEPITLHAGKADTLNPMLQNYSESSKEVAVSFRIKSDALDADIYQSSKVKLKGGKTIGHEFKVQVPKELKNKDGQLKYEINGELSVSIPVSFA